MIRRPDAPAVRTSESVRASPLPPIATPIATALLVLTMVQLIAAWWFPQNVLLRTPLVDITPAEVVVLLGALSLAASRAWRLVQREDLPWLLVFAGYLVWFPVAAQLRGGGADLKPAVVYLIVAGTTAAIAFAAMRARPRSSDRHLVLFFGLALVVAFLGAVLERVTFPTPGDPDPLTGFWRLFRPANVFQHPRLGQLGPPPLHFPLGEGNAIRATGLFFHTNYMAFFSILLAPLMTAVTLRGWHAGRRRSAVVGMAGIVAVTLVTYWTYSRAGLLGLIGVVGMTIVIDAVWRLRTRSRTLRQELGPGVLTAGLLVVTLGGTVLADDLGARRLAATDLPDPIVSDAPFEPGVEGSASRAGQIRVRLQMVALQEVTDSPRSLMLGPGVSAFQEAVHDPASPDHIPEATKIGDPNSLWLTAGLAGGLPGMLLLAGVLIIAWTRLIRSLPTADGLWRRAALLWLGAWVPVWALVQLVGTNPFSLAEAVILSTMLGLAAGLSGRRATLVTAPV